MSLSYAEGGSFVKSAQWFVLGRDAATRLKSRTNQRLVLRTGRVNFLGLITLVRAVPVVPTPHGSNAEDQLLDRGEVETRREVQDGTGEVHADDPDPPVLKLLAVEKELRQESKDEDRTVPEGERASQQGHDAN